MSRIIDLLASTDAVPTQSDPEFANYNKLEQRLFVKSGGSKEKLLYLFRRVKGRTGAFSVAGIGSQVVPVVSGPCVAAATGEVLQSDLLRTSGNYGTSCKQKDNELFVGEPGAVGSIFAVGEMHYYTRATVDDTWVRQSGFFSPTQSNGGSFGASVDYDGSRVIVGENNVVNRANVFTFAGGVATAEQEIQANTYTDASSRFSNGVAVRGSHALIGAPGQDLTVTDQGGVEYWTESGGVWTFQQAFTVNGAPVTSMGFGQSIAMVDNATAYITFVAATGIGVQKWTRAGTTWSYDSQFILTDYDNQGTNYATISTDGTNLIIGQDGFDVGTGTNEGVVVVVSQSGTVLTEIIGSLNEQIGAGVTLDGTEAVIGNQLADPSGTSNAGTAEVWDVCT